METSEGHLNFLDYDHIWKWGSLPESAESEGPTTVTVTKTVPCNYFNLGEDLHRSMWEMRYAMPQTRPSPVKAQPIKPKGPMPIRAEIEFFD